MSHITLPRAAEQARSALNGWANYGLWAWPESALQTCKQNTEEALAALDAALAEPDAKREPATAEQITLKYRLGNYEDSFRDGWREAEWFHGITKEDK